MAKERDEYARKHDGAGMEIENYRVLCSQLEAQISMMHDKGSAKGAAGAHAEQRERSVADGSLSKEDEQRQNQRQQRQTELGEDGKVDARGCNLAVAGTKRECDDGDTEVLDEASAQEVGQY